MGWGHEYRKWAESIPQFLLVDGHANPACVPLLISPQSPDVVTEDDDFVSSLSLVEVNKKLASPVYNKWPMSTQHITSTLRHHISYLYLVIKETFLNDRMSNKPWLFSLTETYWGSWHTATDGEVHFPSSDIHLKEWK
jgi:hypothetical protein